MFSMRSVNELIARLRSPILNEDRMKRWDHARFLIESGHKSSLPRDIFEADLDLLDEDRKEAAEIIEKFSQSYPR